jgi:hypothetical protein
MANGARGKRCDIDGNGAAGTRATWIGKPRGRVNGSESVKPEGVSAGTCESKRRDSAGECDGAVVVVETGGHRSEIREPVQIPRSGIRFGRSAFPFVPISRTELVLVRVQYLD